MPDVALTQERSQRFAFHQTPALLSWSQIYEAPGGRLTSLLDLAFLNKLDPLPDYTEFQHKHAHACNLTPLLPAGEARWDVLPWVYWQAANVGPVFGNKLAYTRYITDVPDEARAHPLERFGKEARRLSGVLDRQLEGRPFVCGAAFTIADIAIYPWLRGWKWSQVDITDRPNVMAWIDRVRARPGVARGLAYGVPEDEIDRWSAKRRESYARGGASIASNERLRSDP